MTAIALLCASTALSAPGLPGPAEDWFKWGDYDSLIALLEPRMRDTARDSALLPPDRARGYLYLGVAYHASGQRRLSDSAFCMACRTDSAITLDQFYVAPDILDHYRVVASECRSHPAPPRPPEAMALTVAAPTPRTRDPDTGMLPVGAEGKGWSRSSLRWWGLGGVALTATLVGGAIWYLQQERPPVDSVTVINGR